MLNVKEAKKLNVFCDVLVSGNVCVLFSRYLKKIVLG